MTPLGTPPALRGGGGGGIHTWTSKHVLSVCTYKGTSTNIAGVDPFAPQRRDHESSRLGPAPIVSR